MPSTLRVLKMMVYFDNVTSTVNMFQVSQATHTFVLSNFLSIFPYWLLTPSFWIGGWNIQSVFLIRILQYQYQPHSSQNDLCYCCWSTRSIITSRNWCMSGCRGSGYRGSSRKRSGASIVLPFWCPSATNGSITHRGTSFLEIHTNAAPVAIKLRLIKTRCSPEHIILWKDIVVQDYINGGGVLYRRK